MTQQLAQMGVSYRDALDRHARMEGYARDLKIIAEPHRFEIAVSWKWGSATTGYEEIRKDVEHRVAVLLPGLIKESVEAARRDADQKLRALTGLAARLDHQLAKPGEQ